MDTHAPYAADPELVKSYLHRYDYSVDDAGDIGEKVPSEFHEKVLGGEYPKIADKYYFPDGRPSTAIVDAHYDAATTESDDRVGNIVNHLRSKDMLDETLLVLLSDHGESLTEHGIYYDHHGLYYVSTHIPLIIRSPTGDNQEISDVVQLTDIAATIKSYTGIDGIQSDGQSLKPAIETGESLSRKFVIAEEAHTQRRRMIRTKDKKLIYLLEGDTICRYCGIQHAPERELYNLQLDRTEEQNIAEENTNEISKLIKKANDISERLYERRPEISEGGAIEYDDEDEVHDRLEALGYR